MIGVTVGMLVIVCMLVPNEPMKMRVSVSTPLLEDVKQSKAHEGCAGDAGKPDADAFAQGNAQPGHDQTEPCSRKNVSASGKRGDGERFRAAPMLRPCGEDKR
jgi:hypothetical protein